MRPCGVDGCAKPHNSHGYCVKHGRRLLLYGDPLGSFQRPPRPVTCTVGGCTKPNERAGALCQMHRWRLDHYGDVHYRRYATGCSVDDCDRPHARGGWCGLHFQRWKRTGTTAEPTAVIPDVKRYPVRKFTGHPLASTTGRALVHRVVLYNETGPGPHPCHWCGTSVRWESTYPRDVDALVVDHVDHDRHNFQPTNLVPSCNPCNSRRRQTANHGLTSQFQPG
jgi:hypothetical protein